MMGEFTLKTSKQFETVDITSQVKKIVKDSKVKEGLCIVYCPHATGAVIINESWDPNIGLDFLDALDKMVPLHAGWRHDKVDNNAAAHIKAAILGPSENIIIKNSELRLGQWQNIFFCEFDGPRTERRFYVKIIKS